MCKSKNSQDLKVQAISQEWKAPHDRCGGSTRAFPDSAAEVSIASPQFLDEIKWEGGQLNLNPASENIITANRTNFLVLGSLNLEIWYKGHSAMIEIFIVNEQSNLLILWQACINLGNLPSNFPEPIPRAREIRKISISVRPPVNISQLGKITESPSEADVSRLHDKLLELCSDVSYETELLPMKCEPYRIELVEGAVPIHCTACRNIPLALRDEIKRELDDMLRKGIIAPVRKATDWCHPICCVPKPDGSLRFTVYLRGLNKYVKRPVHPLTTPVQAVQSIPSDAKWFSSADAKKGYWQIELDKESQM